MSKDYSADLQAIRYTLDESMFTGQGSVRHHSDSSGALVSYSYDTDLWCDTFSYDAYGHRIDPLADTVNEGLFYTGEQWDNSAQSYYLRARYYDSLNGRFNRMDPYSGNTQDPQSLHKYLYAHNNPINGIDPTGQSGDFSITGLLSNISLRTMIFAMDMAPKASAFTWAVTKIAGIIFIASAVYRELELAGWVPETGITEEIQMVSGALFFAGFIFTGILQSIPQIRGRVTYGRTALSRQVQTVRQVNKIGVSPQGTIRNGAAFEYRGDDGKLHTLVRFSSRGGGGHAERIIRNELSQMGVNPSQVTRIYSELQPCSEPRSLSCDLMISKEFPNAQVTWSYNYQNALTQEQSQASVENLKRAIGQLF